jgi:hypothetical protein
MFLQFSVGTSQVLTSKLPPHRVTQHSRAPSASSVSRNSSLPGLSVANDSSDPLTPHTSQCIDGPSTPWKPQKSSNKLAMGQHTPASQSLLKATMKCFCVVLTTTNMAFADEDNMVWEVKAAWRKACDDSKDPSHFERFHLDKEYKWHVTHIVSSNLWYNNPLTPTQRFISIFHNCVATSSRMPGHSFSVMLILGSLSLPEA